MKNRKKGKPIHIKERKVCHAAACILLCLFLAGCTGQSKGAGQSGGSTGGGKDGRVFYDVVSESEALYDVLESQEGKEGTACIGTQYYQGEPVQLWASRSGDGTDISLYRADGTGEVLREGMPRSAASGGGYLDQEGNLYCWVRDGFLQKTAPSGERIYSRELSESGGSDISSIVQTRDGRIYVVYLETEGRGRSFQSLGEMDTETGLITRIQDSNSGTFVLGTGEEGLYCMDSEGIWKADGENGIGACVMPLAETTYVVQLLDMRLQGFRVTGVGEAELLRTDYQGGSWTRETLRTVEAGRGKTALTVRGWYLANKVWFRRQVAAFNRSNDEYYVVLEDCGDDSRIEDVARQSSIEIAAGKGPDLFYGDVLGDYAYGAVQKGGILDLAPYLEASDIREEDYFPSTFGWRRDGGEIYGVNTMLSCHVYRMDAGTLGAEEAPGIEGLAELLLSRSGEGVYLNGSSAQDLLDIFLGGSEDLWGMVDWETWKCDFSGALFSDILETAKRYGDDGHKRYSGLAWEESCWLAGFAGLVSTVDERGMLVMMRQEKSPVVGAMFDDGCHAAAESWSSILSVNAASPNPQGAWEFIRFLLGEEAQVSASEAAVYPVHRKAFRAFVGEAQEKYELWQITDEMLQELEKTLEEARFLPDRPVPVLEIIHEEAEDYFNGSRGIEEVREAVQNRVELYLNENRS